MRIAGLMTALSTMMKTGWVGLEHFPTTGVIFLTVTGRSWTGMMTQTGVTLVGLSSAAASSTSFTGPGVQSGQTAPTWKLVKQ